MPSKLRILPQRVQQNKGRQFLGKVGFWELKMFVNILKEKGNKRSSIESLPLLSDDCWLKWREANLFLPEILHELENELLINVPRFSDACYFLTYYVQGAEIVQLSHVIQLFLSNLKT